MYWYMCRLDASHHCLVVNKGLPFVAVHFAVFVVVPVARIHRTCRWHKSHPSSSYLSLAYIALAVRIHCTHSTFNTNTTGHPCQLYIWNVLFALCTPFPFWVGFSRNSSCISGEYFEWPRPCTGELQKFHLGSVACNLARNSSPIRYCTIQGLTPTLTSDGASAMSRSRSSYQEVP